jgi:protein SCO1/2
MKTMFSLTLAFCATTLVARATETADRACCAEIKPAKPACCASTEPAATAAAATPAANFTRHSLYQLDASWTNDAGDRVRLAEYRGEPVIVAMFFAQCEYACPMLVSDIKRVREALPAAVRDQARVVLVSFDTERDTPAALKAFRQRMALDERWTLLRGDETAVQEFAMLLGVKFKRDARGQFAHSNLVTVLNAEGEIAQQRAGLQGDISELAQAVVVAAR